MNNFSEVRHIQVKPEKVNDFEALLKDLSDGQSQQIGCVSIKYVK